MLIQFTKMHGLGNDFIIINAIEQNIALTANQIQQMANRRFGIGFDQLLLVEKADSNHVDFNYRIFNADGSEVEQCGNGARCFARFVIEQGLTHKKSIQVQTNSGIIELKLENNDMVTVNMGVPIFDPEKLPLQTKTQAETYHLDVDGKTVDFFAVSMGNPHAVIIVPEINQAPVNTLGPILETHRFFPQRVNVGFMQIVSRNKIKLRVFERGTGETQACGTGACAAVVAGHVLKRLDDNVEVILNGGKLQICWQGHKHPVYMTGEAVTVFTGQIII